MYVNAPVTIEESRVVNQSGRLNIIDGVVRFSYYMEEVTVGGLDLYAFTSLLSFRFVPQKIR